MPFLSALFAAVPQIARQAGAASSSLTLPKVAMFSPGIFLGVAVLAFIAASYRYRPHKGDTLREDLIKRFGLFVATGCSGYILARPAYSGTLHQWPHLRSWDGIDALVGALCTIVAMPVFLLLFERLPKTITNKLLGKVESLPFEGNTLPFGDSSGEVSASPETNP